MKRFNYLFMAGLMTLGLGACSDEVDVSGENSKVTGDVYMSFRLELPTASRSATDNTGDTNSDENPDYEVGKDVENAVSRFDIVLATPDNNYTTGYKYITQTSNKPANPQDIKNVHTIKFQSQALEAYEGSDVVAFVFCNHPADTNYKGIVEGTSSSYTISNIADISTANQFWMANAEIPAAKTLQNLNATTEAEPFELGTVKVERTAARFDFKPLATEIDINGDTQFDNNVYVLEEDGAGNPVVTIQLTHMALMNVSNNFNYLRHVGEYGSADPGVAFCKPETPDNYVVDSDAASKATENYLPDNFINYWDAQSGNQSAATPVNFQSLWTSLASSITNIDTHFASASDDQWAPDGQTAPTYKIWQYATENTCPTIEKQIKSLSTMVLFKGRLYDALTGDNNRLKLTESKAYVHNDILYGSWKQVEAKVATVTSSTTDENLIALKAAYNAAGGATEPTLATAATNGFTVIEKELAGTPLDTSDDFWSLYYCYINRHNDNDSADTMGKMEFAVVRNNVYKLNVKNIKKFGHPSNPAGDPDPEIPEDPDESKNVYFEVGVQVLPWTVRVNEIEF